MSSEQWVAGKDSYLYYAVAFTSPTWIEIARRRDVTFNQGKEEGDASAADLGTTATGYGNRTLELSFDYLYKRATDSVFTALLDSLDDDTELNFLRVDDVYTASSSKGYTFPGIVASMNEGAPLNDGITYSVTVKFARVDNSGLVEGARFAGS